MTTTRDTSAADTAPLGTAQVPKATPKASLSHQFLLEGVSINSALPVCPGLGLEHCFYCPWVKTKLNTGGGLKKV